MYKPGHVLLRKRIRNQHWTLKNGAREVWNIGIVRERSTVTSRISTSTPQEEILVEKLVKEWWRLKIVCLGLLSRIKCMKGTPPP
jgi:hypothetical protein